ncbi:GOLPH3/VPS74 family protein [Flexivirga alba]|uniref:GPP34 family phosphoprotein n=1 Tax=Flexivirga alba TaxID=702742 RepID=A0ABW2AC41_9MICO
MLISEEFLLLVTTDEGKWLAGSPAVPIALAGGLLAELAASGRAAVDDRGRLAPPPTPAPLGDPILDRALVTFQQKLGKKPKDVLGKVAKGLGDELYDRLAATGIVECQRGRFLRPNRFPVRKPAERDRIWNDVAAVLSEKSAPDLRTGTLLGLTQAVGAVPSVFSPNSSA